MPLLLAERRVARVIPVKTLSSLGGPAAVNGLSLKQKVKLFDFLRNHLNELAAKHGVMEIDLGIPPMAPAYRGERCPRVNPLLTLGSENALTQTWVVDIRANEMELRRAYAEGTREDLRKIQREQYQVRTASNEHDMKIYYDLHCATFKRSGKTPHPFAYYEHIFKHFVARGLCRIVFFIQNDEVLAAHNTALYKNGALYWTAASKFAKTGGANRLLMDEQIMHAKHTGVEWYETGEAFPHLTDGKYKGISDYKKSFGSVLYPYFKARIVTRPKLQSAINLLYVLRS